MTQLARLYLRGNLVKALQQRSNEEREGIGELISQLLKDPLLQSTKHKFCQILRSTISNEYNDKDVALEDYRIALMRAVIAAKYGWGEHDPSEEVFTDPIQRKKWFQSWVFNYMKQILRENKIPGYKQCVNVTLPADMAIIEEFNNILRDESVKSQTSLRRYLKELMSSIEISTEGDGYRIYIDQWSLPTDVLRRLQDLSDKYLSYNIKFAYDGRGISVRPTSESVPNVKVKQHRDVRVRFSSFEAPKDDDDGHKYYLEFEVSELKNGEENEVLESDSIRALMDALSDDGKEVLKLIIDTPDDYVNRYGTKISKSHMAKYLGVKDRDVSRIMKDIKAHTMALGIGLD